MSTNACELGYQWDPEVREMPAEWFLTQVGTTLTQDVDAWSFRTDAAVGSASIRIDITQTQGTDWQISLDQEPVEVISGTDYTLSFWARADRDRPIDAWMQQNQDPWENYLFFGDAELNASWQFDDPDALGDPATNYFYKVLGEKSDGGSTLSNHTGEFDFGLLPGA